jgi:hypothetical protein
MSACSLLYIDFSKYSWTEATKLGLCMEFIDSLGVEPIFEAFLKHKAKEEYWEGLEGKSDEEEIE